MFWLTAGKAAFWIILALVALVLVAGIVHFLVAASRWWSDGVHEPRTTYRQRDWARTAKNEPPKPDDQDPPEAA